MTAANTAQLSRAALNDYIENLLANAARPLSLAEVFRDVYPGQRATDCALLALRKRLQYLAAEGRLHSDGYGDGRTWSGITEAQRAEQAAQEAAQAAPVALPRRVDVMSGNYVPHAARRCALALWTFAVARAWATAADSRPTI